VLVCAFMVYPSLAINVIFTLSLHDALPILARRDIRAKHRDWVRVEGDNAGRKRALPRFFAEPADQRLVAPVHAIEHTDGQRGVRSEEQTSELQSREKIVCRPLLEKKKRDNR